MVTHDANAASYCGRILFIQDGVLFHELRRDFAEESQQEFYERILKVLAQLGGGSANVLLNLSPETVREAAGKMDCFMLHFSLS